MIPLLAEINVWQSIDLELSKLHGSIIFGAVVFFLLILIAAAVIEAKLKQVVREQRETNRLLEQIAESRGAEAAPTLQKSAGDTPAATPKKPPPIPEPKVYKL